MRYLRELGQPGTMVQLDLEVAWRRLHFANINVLRSELHDLAQAGLVKYNPDYQARLWSIRVVVPETPAAAPAAPALKPATAPAPAGVAYGDSMLVTDDTTLGTLDSLMEMFQEYGSATLKGRRIVWNIEAPDLWELRDMLETLGTQVRSWGYDFEPKRENVGTIVS